MKPLKIIKDNDALLRNKSTNVNVPLSPEDEQIINNMLAYIKLTQDEKYREKNPTVREGVGLAAPQIGVLKKMLVIHFKKNDEETITHALVNPTIVSYSATKCYLASGEGCLSVDNPHEGYVMRSHKIRVSAYDAIKKSQVEIIAKDFEAIVLQHEIDHLSGILYYDHINPLNPKFAPEDAIQL